MGLQRLKAGVSAIVEHKVGGADPEKKVALVQEATQFFITALDGLKLGMKAVDQIYGPLKDVWTALSALGDILPADFSGSKQVQKWVSKLMAMRANDELSEEDLRQMQFDLEDAYANFSKALRQ